MQTIYLHPAAPRKPPEGAPCNGCGVCCTVQPCPLGMVLSRRRTGTCAALRWDGPTALYRCGALAEPRTVVTEALGRRGAWLARPIAAVLKRLARRWIAAGQGCDSDWQPQPSTTMPDTLPPPMP
jgi:hypothetical protein